MEENENQKNNILNNSKKDSINKKNNSKIFLFIIISIILIFIGIITYIIFIESNCENFSKHLAPILEYNDITFNPPIVAYKPIIYLYPEEQINISVKLGNKENITCSYPEYKDGWNVIANPDGTLVDTESGRNLYALYWEGIYNKETNYSDGFVVKGIDTIKFLEEKLSILGLTDREANEFIVYWLPKLQENEYNYIRFSTIDEINNNMPLEFSIKPDTLIRVFMEYKALDEYIQIPKQKLETPTRNGFVVVEWGGSEIQ